MPMISNVPLVLRMVFLAVLLTLPLEARLGESMSQFERRLVSSSGKGIEVRGDELIQFYRQQSPVYGWIEPIKDEVEYKIYFKINEDVIPTSGRLWESAGNRGRRPIRRPEGWLVYVVYYRGQSVLEYYLRSQSISPFEERGLLSLNGEFDKWKRGRLPSSKEFRSVDVLPVNRYLEDGSLYASVGGDHVVIYNPRLDELIVERRNEMQRKEAPASLIGF